MKQRQNEQPQVSVIIACFNAEKYIAAALDSLLAQTMKSWEAVVVDDQSTDASREIVRSYSDRRIRLLCNSTNSGPSISRNRALSESTGHWIAVLDADDQFKPDRLAVLLAQAQSTNADVIADNLEVFEDQSGRVLGTWFTLYNVPVKTPMVLDAEFLAKYEIGVMKAMIRRDFILRSRIEYDAALKYGEDFLLYLQILFAGARFQVIPQSLYRLRRGETQSLTTNHSVLVERIIDLNRRVLAMRETSNNSALQSVLWHRLDELEVLKRYHSLIYPLRKRRFLAALAAFTRDPGAFICVLRHVSARLYQRYKGHLSR